MGCNLTNLLCNKPLRNAQGDRDNFRFYIDSSVSLVAQRKSLFATIRHWDLFWQRNNYNDALNYFEVNPKPFTMKSLPFRSYLTALVPQVISIFIHRWQMLNKIKGLPKSHGGHGLKKILWTNCVTCCIQSHHLIASVTLNWHSTCNIQNSFIQKKVLELSSLERP